MPFFGRRSKDLLKDLDPRLVRVLTDAIKHVDFTILETHRSKERQNRLYRERKTKLRYPYSKHNAYPSLAVDIAVWYPQSPHVHWDDLASFHRLMGVVGYCGWKRGIELRFGIDWNRNWDHRDNVFNDGPHVEIAD